LDSGRRILSHDRVAGLDAEFVRGGQEDFGVGLAVGEVASGDVDVEVVH